MTTRIQAALREFFALMLASFKPEGQTSRFLPFEIYPSSFRPPMKKAGR